MNAHLKEKKKNECGEACHMPYDVQEAYSKVTYGVQAAASRIVKQEPYSKAWAKYSLVGTGGMNILTKEIIQTKKDVSKSQGK